VQSRCQCRARDLDPGRRYDFRRISRAQPQGASLSTNSLIIGWVLLWSLGGDYHMLWRLHCVQDGPGRARCLCEISKARSDPPEAPSYVLWVSSRKLPWLSLSDRRIASHNSSILPLNEIPRGPYLLSSVLCYVCRRSRITVQ
jgi:hypothetical protein